MAVCSDDKRFKIGGVQLKNSLTNTNTIINNVNMCDKNNWCQIVRYNISKC